MLVRPKDGSEVMRYVVVVERFKNLIKTLCKGGY